MIFACFGHSQAIQTALPERHSAQKWGFGKTNYKKMVSSIFLVSKEHKYRSSIKLPDWPRPSNNVEILWKVVLRKPRFEDKFMMSIWSPACSTYTKINIYVRTSRSKYIDLRSVIILFFLGHFYRQTKSFYRHFFIVSLPNKTKFFRRLKADSKEINQRRLVNSIRTVYK